MIRRLPYSPRLLTELDRKQQLRKVTSDECARLRKRAERDPAAPTPVDDNESKAATVAVRYETMHVTVYGKAA